MQKPIEIQLHSSTILKNRGLNTDALNRIVDAVKHKKENGKLPPFANAKELEFCVEVCNVITARQRDIKAATGVFEENVLIEIV